MVPMFLGLNKCALCAPHQFIGGGGPVTLLKFQMAPKLTLLMSTGSKKEPRYACLSAAETSHSRRTWAEVSSSALHLLHIGLTVPLSEDVSSRYYAQ